MLRLAAARGALERLAAATPVFSDLPVPDLILASGGVWSVAPPAAVALAILDLLRRPGVTQLAYDHARLLGPIGTIEDEAERRVLLAELAEDLLSPLATAVVPRGSTPAARSGASSCTPARPRSRAISSAAISNWSSCRRA